MQEYRYFGPPGCGKTTSLSKKSIPAAVKQYGPDKIVVTSFTKAAAREIAGRDLPVNPKNVGTLHALCYRLFGNPDLALNHIDKWNSSVAQRLRITGKITSSLDEGGMDNETINGDGDNTFNQINIKRAKIIPTEMWKPSEQGFYKKWTEFKENTKLMDFTDLIEKAVTDLPYAPGRPEIIFVDEAQDFTPLQLKLIRSWGIHCKRFVLVGDDDQNLYNFAGATPDGFLNPPLDAKFKKVLNQSYRVPRAIHEKAMKMIKHVRTREVKEYLPKICPETGDTIEGSVENNKYTWQDPENYISQITDLTDQGLSVMILASCSYMLDPLKKELRNRALPFHNPYRTKRGDWNPLQRSNERTNACDLLLNFLESGTDDNYWNVRQFYSWAKNLKTGENGMVRKLKTAGLEGIKKELEENPDNPALASCRPLFSKMVSQNGIEQALNRNLDWFYEHLLKDRKKSMGYPIDIYKQHGLQALRKEPNIILGTIHSVKGAESDCVFLYPDISWGAHKERIDSREAQDALYRLFYVAMTRAKEKLILMSPAGGGKNSKRLAMEF